jgi:hypothetical protein
MLAVVQHYDDFMKLGLTPQQVKDLITRGRQDSRSDSLPSRAQFLLGLLVALRSIDRATTSDPGFTQSERVAEHRQEAPSLVLRDATSRQKR